jgi:hypothetical protein
MITMITAMTQSTVRMLFPCLTVGLSVSPRSEPSHCVQPRIAVGVAPNVPQKRTHQIRDRVHWAPDQIRDVEAGVVSDQDQCESCSTIRQPAAGSRRPAVAGRDRRQAG